MAKICAGYKSGVVIMHMKGNPRTMQKNPVYGSLMGEILDFLKTRVNSALDSGISPAKIIIDPGIGFGKTFEHNLEIIGSLKELKILGLPILIGTSRKGFLGKILNLDPEQRLAGTTASCVLAVNNGAEIVRVHDVKFVSQALKVTSALIKG